MRISDWSSDVCSSDLRRNALLHGLAEGIVDVHQHGGLGRDAAAFEHRLHQGQAVAHQHRRGREVAENVFVARSEEHTSELQSLMRISYAVFCLKKNKQSDKTHT